MTFPCGTDEFEMWMRCVSMAVDIKKKGCVGVLTQPCGDERCAAYPFMMAK
jgi:hypothetical protein